MKTILSLLLVAFFAAATSHAQSCADGVFLGRLSANPYITTSTANAYGPYGSVYSATSIKNPYSQYGSTTSPVSVANPYATAAPKIIATDGTYLGKLSANPYDPQSIANPYGKFGSPYSPTSVNNPYSIYGSPYSPVSPKNPFAIKPPILCGEK
jgi:hypothetical protein